VQALLQTALLLVLPPHLPIHALIQLTIKLIVSAIPQQSLLVAAEILYLGSKVYYDVVVLLDAE
jgi:hypothetical protein